MPTITKSIGSGGGRDVPTLQAFEDLLPASLVADGNHWVGEAYNDSGFSAGVTFSDHTTDATHTVTLTAAAGQSFQDVAAVRTSPLRVADGVYIQITATYTTAVDVSGVVDYFTFSRFAIQLLNIHEIAFNAALNNHHHLLKDIVIESPGANGFSGLGGIVTMAGTATYAVNVLLIITDGGAAGVGFGFFQVSTGKCIGCTCVRYSDFSPAGIAFEIEGSSEMALVDCCSFGMTTCASGAGTWVNSSNNATDLASGMPGTSNQHSVTYNATTPFVESSSSGRDARAIIGTALAGNGLLDSTNAPNDISGLARPASPTIGHWQLAVTGGLSVNIQEPVIGSSFF